MSAVSLLLAAIAPIVQSVGEYEHWRLSFDAKVEGEHVIENYPQYEKLFFCGPYAARSYGQPLANWSVTFTDRDGKTVRQAPNWNAFYTTVFSSKMRRYSDAFIVPPGGVKAEIAFHEPNAGERLVVANVKFEKVARPATLNLNPDFALGPSCFAGWSAGVNRRIVEDPDEPGRNLLVAGSKAGGGSVRSDWIPVAPGDTIRFAYKMRATKGLARVVIMTYKSNAQRDDGQSGTLSKSFFMGPGRWTEGSYEFVVPPEVRVLRLYGDNVTLGYARFTRVGK